MLAPAGTGVRRMEEKKREREVSKQQRKHVRNTRQVELLEQGDKRMAGVSGHLEALVSELRRDGNSDEIKRQSERLAELEKPLGDNGDLEEATRVRQQRMRLLVSPSQRRYHRRCWGFVPSS